MRIRPVMLAALLGAAGAASAAPPLTITTVDVEGGAATLFVTPQGHSLLIDTGWARGRTMERGPAPPGPQPTSAEKIVAAARAAHLTRIDYLLVTHYHADHVGAVAELAAAFPIGTFLDHGENRELGGTGPDTPAVAYPEYLAVAGRHPHRVLKAGERLRIDGLILTAIDSDGQIVPHPLPGAGKSGVGCAGARDEAHDGGIENPRSLGVLLSWGRARILALGDTTWQVENRLVCPVDRIGPVDLMFADNHGSDNGSSQPFLDTLRPRVVVLPNGPTKGADPATFDRLARVRPRPVLWQLHSATRSPDKETLPSRIVNAGGGEADRHLPLRIDVDPDAAIMVTNPRTGASETYRPAAP